MSHIMKAVSVVDPARVARSLKAVASERGGITITVDGRKLRKNVSVAVLTKALEASLKRRKS